MNFSPKPTTDTPTKEKSTAQPAVDYDTSCGRGNFDENCLNDYDNISKNVEKKPNQNRNKYQNKRGNNNPSLAKSKSMDMRSSNSSVNFASSGDFTESQQSINPVMTQSSSISDLESSEQQSPRSPKPIQRYNSTQLNSPKGDQRGRYKKKGGRKSSDYYDESGYGGRNNGNNNQRRNDNKNQTNSPRGQSSSGGIQFSKQQQPPPSTPPPRKEEPVEWTPNKK